MEKTDNQVVIVTGSGRGIGKGIAKCFIDEGASVVIATYEHDEGKATANEFISQGGDATFIQTDVSSEESIKNMINQTIEKYGKIDILINNAGITIFKTIEEATIEDWERLINIDLRGPFLCSKYALPYLKKQKGASIINISSNHSVATLPNTEIYAAAKGGVNAMTRSMALSLGEMGVRVNTISPGFTETPHYHTWLSEFEDGAGVHKDVIDLHATNQICTPEDIGHMAVFLASNKAKMMTGENVIVDGGISARLYNSDVF